MAGPPVKRRHKIAGMHLKLPATSANLGPGFDAVGLAMSLYLTIDAEPADVYSIVATGRNADLCSDVENSLILTTYRELLGPAAPPLALSLHNEIPLGMGCGSSAAAILAGVLLAHHFGNIPFNAQLVLNEATRREGHPDNVAACLHGGMTSSAMVKNQVVTATCGVGLDWKLLVALPSASLATEKARALLPPAYSRADAVANVQSTAMLVSAFALNRPDLLRHGMRDRLHQPFRMEACPLLAKLLPLAFHPGIYGVALSGAGPSVLLIVDPGCDVAALIAVIECHAREDVEVVTATISEGCFGALP